MKLYLYISCLLVSLFGCKKRSCSYAIIGGEIINKSTNYVVLSKAEDIIDTLRLDKNNRFTYKVKNLIAGLYTFSHGNEIQKLLLEPGDSIMFRLNTLEFDESLVYTGKGAKKNNYLIDDFLLNEKEEKRIYQYCSLSPSDYEKRLDSIRHTKLNRLTEFLSKNPEASQEFITVANANINYSYFASKEAYPFVYYGRKKEKRIPTIPDNFYRYRDTINYNDAFLIHNFNYKTFLKRSFTNMALTKHLDHIKNINDYVWTNSCYNLDRMATIDSLVKDSDIKNDLLYYYSMKFLSKNKNIPNNEKVVNYFLSKSTDNENNTKIEAYSKAINKLRPGAKLPNVELRGLDNNIIAINSLIAQPTVVYFWSHSYKDYFKNTHKRVRELNSKYPEISFISVNIDDYGKDVWHRTVKKHRYTNRAHEYMFKDPELSVNQLGIYPVTKAILVSGDQEIINSHANIFATNFEEELLELINTTATL